MAARETREAKVPASFRERPSRLAKINALGDKAVEMYGPAARPDQSEILRQLVAYAWLNADIRRTVENNMVQLGQVRAAKYLIKHSGGGHV